MSAKVRAQLAALMERRTCVRCDVVYTELENLGTWHCSHHPGVLDNVWARHVDARGNMRGTYSCCGRAPPLRPAAADGCARCDHTDVEQPPEEPICVEAEHARQLLGERRLSAPGVAYEASRHAYTIYRHCIRPRGGGDAQ